MILEKPKFSSISFCFWICDPLEISSLARSYSLPSRRSHKIQVFRKNNQVQFVSLTHQFLASRRDNQVLAPRQLIKLRFLGKQIKFKLLLELIGFRLRGTSSSSRSLANSPSSIFAASSSISKSLP